MVILSPRSTDDEVRSTLAFDQAKSVDLSKFHVRGGGETSYCLRGEPLSERRKGKGADPEEAGAQDPAGSRHFPGVCGTRGFKGPRA